MKTDSYLYTSAGGREDNQDAVGSTQSKVGELFVLADGLGGYRFGNLASQLTVQSMSKDFQQERNLDGGRIYDMISRANDAVLQLQREKCCQARSTVVLLALSGGRAIWGNTGDSRLYFIHRGRLESYTEDHSVAYKKYKAGEITREEIPQDEDQSCLLRSLGNETRWKPDLYEREGLEKGDAFLLCSDGLWEYVTDREIAEERVRAKTAEEWAGALLSLAEKRFRRGNDNFSVITVIIE